jgi:hypothetical protein
MATKRKKSSRKQKPFWERAYKGHAYWQGKVKLGKVTLLADNDARSGKYRWETAARVGYSVDLNRARRAVELAVAMADKQLDLFE